MRRGWLEGGVIALASLLLLLTAAFHYAPIDFIEASGFVTGAVCVWLVTKQNIWNWPIGLLNNLFFAFLFWRARLFADMGLQGVYFILGLWGWWNWLFGGLRHQRLGITRTTPIEWAVVPIFLVLTTWGMHEFLISVHGASPFWDALTTMLCLAAQYLLCRKRFENWWFWIAADLIYVPLYLSRHLPLTALLYTGFIVLCGTGLYRWQQELRSQNL